MEPISWIIEKIFNLKVILHLYQYYGERVGVQSMEASLDPLSGRTFSINISNDGVACFREAIKQKLTVFMGSYTYDVLPMGLSFHSLLVPFCSIAVGFHACAMCKFKAWVKYISHF